MILTILFLFIFGISVGSFINAFVYRIQNRKGFIFERSICPKCKHKLEWFDLLPIFSFFILKGRCRYCKDKILWHYPFVEFLTGIVFILPFLTGFKADYYLIYIVFSIILMIILAYDLRYMLIPDKITLPSILIVLIIQVAIFKLGIAWFLFAGIISSLFFLLQFIISKGYWIGGGDIRLGFLIGIMVGWPAILLSLMVAYLLGSVVSLPLVMADKKGLKSKVPFGVFLSISTIIVLVFGQRIIGWYLDSFI